MLEVSVSPDGQGILDSNSMMSFTTIPSGNREYLTVDQIGPNYYQLGFIASDALVWLNFSDTDTVDPAAALAIADQVDVVGPT